MTGSTGPLLAVAAGVALGLSLIVAIGAQNVFVLRQGLKLEHVGPVVAVCSLSDLLLIATGTAGGGVVVNRWPTALTVARLGAALFLAGYGLLAVRRALRPTGLADVATASPTSRARVLLACLAFTYLNPHVYLDTVVLLGSIAQTHGQWRWWFALGAGIGDTLWFVALGYSARLLRPVLARPGAWRVLDAAIAAVMLTLAILLLRPQ